MTKTKPKEPFKDIPMRADLVFGIDVGIASCGWAVVDKKKNVIRAIGSHCFEAAEEPKTRKLKNQNRREKRGMRRIVKRRRARLANIRKFLEQNGVCKDCSPEHLRKTLFVQGEPPFDVWSARVRGLGKTLPAEETAAVLLHLAKHRGYFSNSKQERGKQENIASEGKAVLKAIQTLSDSQHLYSSYAEQVSEHEALQGRKRNRQGDYKYMPTREGLRDEARKIIEAQKASWATQEFAKRYSELAFDQLPIASGEKLVGTCLFEDEEKRTSRFAPTFERFRLAAKLAHERIEGKGASRSLQADEIHKVLVLLGENKVLTYKKVRKALAMEEFLYFASAPRSDNPQDDPESKDITGTTSGAGTGTHLLRQALQALGETAYRNIAAKPFCLDRVADYLSFNDDVHTIERRLNLWQKEFSLPAEAVTAVLLGVEQGKFNALKGAAHISAKAAHNILPFLEQGLVYSEACARAGYDHRRMRKEGELEKIPNAVVRRALIRAQKQVQILVQEYGRPEKIHIETTRDIGKSAKARGEIENAIKKRTGQRDAWGKQFLENVGRDADAFCSNMEKLNYELWLQQKGRCLYCEKSLTPEALQDGRNETQIDHVWPRSRFPDNSMVNKVLACTTCNQNKRGKTPWEWRGEDDSAWWQGFESRIKAMTCKKEKKRRLLSKTFADRLREEGFASRNLVDTGYIARRLLQELQSLYPESYRDGMLEKGSTRPLYARPGRLTAELRRAWLQGVWKKTRDDDRHHAIDALVVALTDEGRLQALTKHFQLLEGRGFSTHRLKKFEPPWENFAEDTAQALEGWYVSRSEIRRVRGAGHEATVYRKRAKDGKILQRVALDKLTAKQLANLPDKETGNRVVHKVLSEWLTAEKPQEGVKALPMVPSNKKIEGRGKVQGKVIRAVLVEKNEKSTRTLNERYMGSGQVKNESIFRTDVYYLAGDGYYIVPVYNYEILTKGLPTPCLASVYKREWKEMRQEDYLFSLYRWSYVAIAKRDGQEIEGYFRGMDRATASIMLSQSNSSQFTTRGLGVKSFRYFRKFTIDRLGNKFEIKKEKFPRKHIGKTLSSI